MHAHMFRKDDFLGRDDYTIEGWETNCIKKSVPGPSLHNLSCACYRYDAKLAFWEIVRACIIRILFSNLEHISNLKY